MKKIILISFLAFGLYTSNVFAQTMANNTKDSQNQAVLANDSVSKNNSISSSSLRVLYNAQRGQAGILVPDSTSTKTPAGNSNQNNNPQYKAAPVNKNEPTNSGNPK